MALIGNCFTISYSDHPTNTVTETITFPDDTTEEITRPEQVEAIETYNDVYLVIIQVENFNDWAVGTSSKDIVCFYRAYESADLRDQNTENYLFEGNLGFSPDFELPLYQQIYSEIKNIRGLETLIDG